MKALQAELRRLLAEFVAAGARIAAYWAAAKGATLLNATGIGAETIQYVVRPQPARARPVAAGHRAAHRGPFRAARAPPRRLLLLAWTCPQEVRTQQADYERAGKRVIVPVT